MSSVELCHTYQLSQAQLDAVHQLLLDSFPLGVTDDDFANSLGGMHAVVWNDRDQLIAHASVVPRRMMHQGRSLRTGYVEAVAVATDHRRQRLGSRVMDAIETVIKGGYDLGALSASSDGQLLYADRAWRRWTGTTSVVSPEGIRRTPEEDGSVYVMPVSASLDFDADLACDWRAGDVW